MTQDRFALKFLKEGATSPVQRFIWPVPRGSRPGKWVEAQGELKVCANGIHAVRLDRGALEWLDNPELWVIELGGERFYDEQGHKLVARKGRLIRRIDGWNETNQRLLATDCAYHVLGIFEKHRPSDKRPREAIRAARQYARRPTEANRKLMHAAGAAAGDAESDWQTHRLAHYIQVPELSR